MLDKDEEAEMLSGLEMEMETEMESTAQQMSRLGSGLGLMTGYAMGLGAPVSGTRTVRFVQAHGAPYIHDQVPLSTS